MAALEALIAGIKVRCEAVERDRHGRLVAKVFSASGVDIGRRLVSAGWRWRYSTDYVAAEARKARRGMWRGTFVKPWGCRVTAPPRRLQASRLSAPALDATAAGWSAIFQWIEWVRAGRRALRYRAGRTVGEVNVHAPLDERGTTSE